MNSDGAEGGGDALLRGIGKLPTIQRIAIFGAVSWVLAVIIFVVLFESYGEYLREDDILHMLAVIFMPIASMRGLFWAYDRYVR